MLKLTVNEGKKLVCGLADLMSWPFAVFLQNLCDFKSHHEQQ
jgi:hypothetical protein